MVTLQVSTKVWTERHCVAALAFQFQGDHQKKAGKMSYGNIMLVETTGASWKTSRQDRLDYSGVSASHEMARTDARTMQNYRSKIKRVGNNHGIDPALIAGIISRESRAGNQLDNGYGDQGRAWGLMQVDITSTGGRHPKIGNWDSEEHLSHATGILVGFINDMRARNNGWNKEQQLKAGIAAYNKGPGKIPNSGNVDVNTTEGDYSNDVVARAQWYKNNGY